MKLERIQKRESLTFENNTLYPAGILYMTSVLSSLQNEPGLECYTPATYWLAFVYDGDLCVVSELSYGMFQLILGHIYEPVSEELMDYILAHTL